MKKQLILSAALSLFSTLVLAHPGHALSTAYAGFMHPLMGWDHLLMMLAVGFWAAKSSGRMRWQLPLSFISFMAVGAGLGFLGLTIAGIETAIAASLIAMGILLVISLPIAKKSQVLMVAIFALCHGLAHGVELSGSNNVDALFGMLATTAFLHAGGYWLGTQQSQIRSLLNTGLAVAMLLLGGVLLMQ